MKSLTYIATTAMALLMLIGCERGPVPRLHTDGHVEFDMPDIQIDLDVLWAYEPTFDWHAEWTYGWDDIDKDIMGEIGYTEPTAFDLRRYYLGPKPNQPHTMVEAFTVNDTKFRTKYLFGYYDILAWNNIFNPDFVQSLIFDETSTLDSVMVFTNRSTISTRYQAPVYDFSFNQPEELFAGYERNIHITDKLSDYDSYDPDTRTYFKKMEMELHPVTYIYLTQVRLHNNNGKVTGTNGDANLSGMARGVTLNSGIANKDVISVYYNVRFKRDCTIRQTGEKVDIAGGRCLTFGIPNQNSSRVTRAEDVNDRVKHYMDVNLIFHNGMDSTMVFDITDQVRNRYRGGVITIDIDMDTIQVPQRPGGSAFNAVVNEFNEENFFIDI